MYPKAVDYVSVLAPSAIHAEFEAPPKCRISLQSPAFSRFQPLKSPTRFHEDPLFIIFIEMAPVLAKLIFSPSSVYAIVVAGKVHDASTDLAKRKLIARD